MGGDSACENMVISNKIYDGAAEGIFMADSGQAQIYHNRIYNNAIGISLSMSRPIIAFNKITQN
jgi:parallel beta-helix repeat protein